MWLPGDLVIHRDPDLETYQEYTDERERQRKGEIERQRENKVRDTERWP